MAITGTAVRYKRNPDRWRVRATVGHDPTTGKVKQLSAVVHGDWGRPPSEREPKGSPPPTEVERARYRLIEDAEQLRRDWQAAPERMTVAEAVHRWLDFRREEWAGATLDAYLAAVDRVLDGMGDRLISSVKVSDIDRWYKRLRTDGVGAPSIVKVHVVMSGAFGLAERWGAITVNPVRLAKKPTVEEREVDPPDPLVLATALTGLLDAHPAMGAWILCAAGTGMRPGEQCGLRWSDVDLELGTADVRRAVRKDGRGGWHISTTKTKKVRRVALAAKVVELFTRMRSEQEEACASLDGTLDPDSYVFTRNPTDPDFTNPHLWRQRWTKPRLFDTPDGKVSQSIRDHYGLPGMRLYSLRHFAATHMVADGHDPVTIARMMGHNPSMLLERYAHPISDNARKAVDAVDRKLG